MDKIIAEDCLARLPEIDFSPARGKTVLVTGANGMIGTYLVCFLHAANVVQEAGIRVAAVSRHPPCGKLAGLFREGGERYRFLTADLADGVPELPWKTDFILHAATYAQPETFMKNFSETVRLNVSTTEELLRRAKDDGAKLLFLSSSEIYGSPDPAHIPTREDYPGLCPPLSLRYVYAESKRMGETLCFAYRKLEGVDAKIARISMTYGPGLTTRDKRVMGQFLREALREKKIVMLDDGRKVRTFCYAADCAAMLLSVLFSGKDAVYNVGGTDRLTIRQLAEEICRQTGSSLSVGKPRLPSQKEVEVSPDTVELDVTKIRSEFGLPLTPFREGLARTVAWNRAALKNGA